MSLPGKVTLVFGGTGNIGSAIVEELLQHDVRVIAAARLQHGLTALADRLSGRIVTFQADCRREDDVQRCFRDASQSVGKIDYVVYTPGIAPDPDVPLAQYKLAAWQATFDIYVTGFFLVLRESLTTLPVNGHLVAVSSAVTRLRAEDLPPAMHVGHYAAAKAAMDELCKWGRREAHQRGILLSRIAPAAVDTPFHRNAPPHRRPTTMLPPQSLAQRIVSILATDQEADELIVA